ncbi:hypothetical protein Hte_009120 [Hypoxylon texense]
MVTTRSQDKSHEPHLGDKRSHSKAPSVQVDEPEMKQQRKEPTSKPSAIKEKDDTAIESSHAGNHKIRQLISQYGGLPLSDTDLSDPEKSTPETALALLLNAMLSSPRISHGLAAKTITLAIKAGYHKLDVLKGSTWEERTEVLTEGGYTHYRYEFRWRCSASTGAGRIHREKTATMMGDLAQLIEDNRGQVRIPEAYTNGLVSLINCSLIEEGDLNTIPKLASEDPAKIRAELKNIKGLGDVGINIFFDTAQHIWPCISPYIDPRSLKTAEAIGIGGDMQALFQEVGGQPKEMCKLAAALTMLRLDGKEKEFQG